MTQTPAPSDFDQLALGLSPPASVPAAWPPPGLPPPSPVGPGAAAGLAPPPPPRRRRWVLPVVLVAFAVLVAGGLTAVAVVAGGLTYLQTDAAIAGGQSGGALVDGEGNLLGISGLGFADEFALALSADDVAASIARLRAGDADARRVMPTLDAAVGEAIDVTLSADHPARSLLIPAAGSRRDVPFELVDHTVDGATVEVGTPLRHVVDGFTYDVIHPVELRAGEEIEITVHAGSSDAYFTLLEPGEAYDLMAEPTAEDGGGGIYDLDPRESFEIDRSGTYRIVVGTWEGVVAGYELTVRRSD